MNRRQRGFVRELGRTASVLAEYLGENSEGSMCPPLGTAIWKSMFFLSRDVRAELAGLLKGSSSEDCFEISEWFEYMRNAYGRYCEVLTFCQIVCCAFRTGMVREASDALRILSRTVIAGNLNDCEPDMVPVWQFMIKRKESFFGECSGGKKGVNAGGPADNPAGGDAHNEADRVAESEAVFGRMLLQLCCCAGEDRKYSGDLKMLFGFLRALSEEPEARERILAVLRSEAAGGDARLYCALETAR